MDAKTWASVKDIFAEVVELHSDERAAKLDAICNGNGEIRSHVEALLRSNDEVAGFIEAPAFTIADAMSADAEPAAGKSIGHYRVVREIGRGGMGTVFLAMRDDGEFRQEVAIKVVSSAFLGRESLRRFRQERQILAGLSHPNIARLLDGGVTDDGLPFLVMEHVAGEPLIKYADKNNLSTDERLRLFLKICRAFSYAHGNLIVHRDIKPSNILVTPEGEPKLLDFGLAKILDIESDNVRTATNLRALTPAYASPEQLRGDTITTASDIYSLGVVLYELLSGTRPFDYESVTLEKMIQMASDSDPAPPSVSAGRKDRASASDLKGDLDLITLTAMRTDAERRYGSVQQLADDIERHLDGRPVSAAPDTFAYRTAKFVRRNRIGVASAAVIALILIAGIVATAWQASVAAHERDQATREKEKAEQLNQFLQSILSAASPNAMGKNAKVIAVLDDAASRINVDFAYQPELRARALSTIGQTYNELGVPETAEPKLREALRIYDGIYAGYNKEKARARLYLADSLIGRYAFDEAEPLLNEMVAAERLHQPAGADLSRALFLMGEMNVRRSQFAVADRFLDESITLCDALPSPAEIDCAYYRISLGRSKQFTGDLDAAEMIFRRSLSVFNQQPERYAVRIADISVNLGDVLLLKRSLLEGLALLQHADNTYEAQVGESFYLVISKYYISRAHLEMDNPQEALKFAAQAVEIARKVNWIENRNYIGALRVTGLALTRLAKPNEGEPFLREAVQRAEKHLKPDDPRYADAVNALNECLTARGQGRRVPCRSC